VATIVRRDDQVREAVMSGDSDRVRVVRSDERTVPAAAQTPGMRREQAIVDDHSWVGAFTAAAGTVSGWHHHGEYETSIYVVSGALRMEFGHRGGETLEARPVDFLYVAPYEVHRAGNPSEEPGTAVVVRAGHGEPVTNVDGPSST